MRHERGLLTFFACFFRFVAVSQYFYAMLTLTFFSLYCSACRLVTQTSDEANAEWTYDNLTKSWQSDYVFASKSEVTIWFFQTLAEFKRVQRRQLLRFVTGSPHFPFGGRSLIMFSGVFPLVMARSILPSV